MAQQRRFDLLDINGKISDLDNDSKKYVEKKTKGGSNANVISYSAIGYSNDADCKNMVHGALVVRLQDARMIILEYGDITDIDDDTRLKHHQHPNASWFVCTLREQQVPPENKIKLKDILLHAELWKQEMPYLWKNKTSYPNNCYGYADSAIVSVFKDKPISKDAIRWVGYSSKRKRKRI